jgi:hypothetical protein
MSYDFRFDTRTDLRYPLGMAMKTSSLRENLYRILDQVLETGIPVEIERRGKILKIMPAEPRSKLTNLKPRPYLLSDPEDLVEMDWSGEWRP